MSTIVHFFFDFVKPDAWVRWQHSHDAGVPVVLAGLPKVRTYLSRNHPDRGEIILDVSEGEKAKLSVEDLMTRFYEVQGEAFSSDRMLLV